jgi:hypothetical protein
MTGQRRTRQTAVVAIPSRDGDPLAQLLAADARAAEAGRRLRALQARAFAGTGYDPAAFDAAVLAYRTTQGEARVARMAWVRWHQRGQRMRIA